MVEPSHAFLLRCWQEPGHDGEMSWRFLVIHINKKREKKGFASLDAAVAYLDQILKASNCYAPEGRQPGNNISP